eukprot:Gregarina_sp_Pseudo_9__1601@NODE_2079_length_1162_cov_19_155833_g1920_i0_p1_GENE_NODE_2079_length_1162_cov_19_155833_g1920_i0NODE_2079_length_1162_cov_19_155833_g1920_i0_p1_ORF_typecomplete_len366_score80_92YL1/PF05764_13/1_8e04YL1/PF05764_13/1_2e14YL1/PF05764_13/1e03YL1_C/PF08265_11/4_7e06DUF5341/PF17276_2/3_1e03DUF5341/PF17276_2/0_12HEPN_RnaseLS/PF18869_1/0_21HEPN_RnaseLS/PF18869_1/5e03HEPN_RnaseLS/PF18869_1/2_6e03DUF4680/PF15730_5/1_6e03DUF4680/PF15730_5/1_8e02DUF4680/PF15730_5/4_3e03DUF4680/
MDMDVEAESDKREDEAEDSASNTSSLKLATSSSSSAEEEEEEEEEDDSEEYPIEQPPEHKELPARATRGRRLNTILETEEDQLFWGHETWEEEDNDDEWQTDDEGHYRDKFDSDFLSSDSDNEQDEIRLGEKVDKELGREERRQKKKFDYEKIAKRRKQRKESSQRIWSVFDLEKQLAQNPSAIRKKGAQKILLQADHLRIAKQTEEVNRRILVQIVDEIESRKLRQGQQNAETKSTGEVTAWVSWSSDRKIEYEEERKSEAQKMKEAMEPVKERQLLFFMNLGQPSESRVPDMYRQSPVEPTLRPQCSVFPHLPVKYRDPHTGACYSSVEAFSRIRHQSMQQDLNRVHQVLQRTLDENEKPFPE